MKNNNPKGIILILLGMFIFSIQDSMMKYIYSSVSLYEVYLIRTLVSFTAIFLYLKITNKPIIFYTHYPLLTLSRVILFFFGFSSFYISLTIMPLATATTLFFCSPFLITIFAKFILKEQIGPRRWSAVIVGFLGVYVVLNPDFSNFNYLSLTPVLCAFCYALSIIIIKITSDRDDVYAQMFQFYIGATIISVIFYFFIGAYFSIINGITSDEYHQQLNWEIHQSAIISFFKSGSYDVLLKKIEVLEIDDTPAYGLETVLKIGINGVIECI